MKAPPLLVVAALLLTGTGKLGAAAPTLRAVMGTNQLQVFVEDRLFTTYRFGGDLKYPYFYPVIGPQSGRSITAHQTEPYPHHSSVFFGCDRVNGGNYWQEGLDRGRIASLNVRLGSLSDEAIEFEQECSWERPGAPSPFLDSRRIRITAPTATRRVIDFEITLKAKSRVRIEKSNHSLFAVRMAPDLAVLGGGALINAAGETAEKGTFGRPSPWMDARGRRGDATEGVTLFVHPQNPWTPTPWFTRDYGFFSPTPMNWLEDAAFELAEGQTLHLRYRVLVHADAPAPTELQRLYREWAAATSVP